MLRIAAVLFLGLVLVGCRSSTSQGPVDPFLGPTRIPPPATGSVYTPPPDPSYYQPQQHLPPQSVAPTTSFPMAALPAQSAGQPGDRTGAVGSQQGWSAVPSFSGASLVSQSATPDLQPQPDPRTATAAAIVNREPIIRVLEPAPRPAAAATPSSYNPVPTRVVNIVDLPRVSDTVAAGFRTVSDAGPGDGASAVVPAIAEQPAETFTPSAGSYGFDPSYTWLRGKLEYSQVDRQWKLRYIPVEGNTDQYGGSVVIMNESALSGCERGEFVAVRGRITGEGGDRGFAPPYEVTALQRLSR
ncbi:MAG: hypothetical protein RBS80_26200 [Thermoguttaceae bacterium]|nr:hypothetical protein [Thermoguttaceae bacterium]